MTDEQIRIQAEKEFPISNIRGSSSTAIGVFRAIQKGKIQSFTKGAQWHRDNADGWVKIDDNRPLDFTGLLFHKSGEISYGFWGDGLVRDVLYDYVDAITYPVSDYTHYKLPEPPKEQ